MNDLFFCVPQILLQHLEILVNSIDVISPLAIILLNVGLNLLEEEGSMM